MPTEKQLASLAQGRQSRKGMSSRARLNLTVKPSTKAWLEKQGNNGKMIDQLVEQAQSPRGYEFGLMRLVNPDRNSVYVAQLFTGNGVLSARTEDFELFSIYSVQVGKEFYPGRKFSRKELASFFLAESILPDQRKTLSDEFGDIPAIAPNPQSWKWYAIHRGEERLKQEYKPTALDFQRVSGAALSLTKGGFYPLIDPYEIWVCDKDSQEPLFLAMTGTSLEDVDRQTFSPMWRFNWHKCTSDTEVPLRKLQEEINSRVNTSDTPGKFGWFHRLFKRNLDGSAIEYSQSLEEVQTRLSGYLPDGTIAEPYATSLNNIQSYGNNNNQD